MSSKDPNRKEIVQKGVYDVGEVVLFLDELVAGLRKGTVYVHNDTDAITLKPQGHVELELKAVEKTGKAKFEFELEWAVSTGEDSNSIGVQVSTTKPDFLSANKEQGS